MKLSKGQELMQTVITKAWEDEAFKQELIENPKATIEKLTGEKINLPEGKKLLVRDQTSEKVIYINIPTKPNLADVELNEEQLEVISGGGDENNGFSYEAFVAHVTDFFDIFK